MKKLLGNVLALVTAGAFAATVSFAAVKTYQVTGQVLEVNDKVIALQKGKDRWEIARNADTKVTGDLKVGSKVTIQYSMAATSIEAKSDKSEAKPAADKPAKTR